MTILNAVTVGSGKPPIYPEVSSGGVGVIGREPNGPGKSVINLSPKLGVATSHGLAIQEKISSLDRSLPRQLPHEPAQADEYRVCRNHQSAVRISPLRTLQGSDTASMIL